MTSGQVAVTTNAIVIVAAASTVASSSGGSQSGRDVFLTNSSGATVFLGGSSAVTTGTGCPLAASATLKLSLSRSDAIYGIVASTGSTVSFLATGS